MPEAVETLRARLPVHGVAPLAAGGRHPGTILAEALLQRQGLTVTVDGGLHQLGQPGDQAIDLLRGEELRLAHGASTKIACTSLGPCTPRVRVSSMSAVREGPVMKLIIAPDVA